MKRPVSLRIGPEEDLTERVIQDAVRRRLENSPGLEENMVEGEERAIVRASTAPSNSSEPSPLDDGHAKAEPPNSNSSHLPIGAHPMMSIVTEPMGPVKAEPET